MRFKGGVWKPVVAELRKRLIFESCLEGRPIQGDAATEDVDKILDFLFP